MSGWSLGQRPAGFIYGTLVALSVIAAEAPAKEGSGKIALVVAVTCLVFWLAHVYAHGIGYSVARKEHLSLGELRRIARREASIVEAAILPVAVLLVGETGLYSARTAVWLAFVVGLAELFAQGLVVARLERFGLLGTIALLSVNLALGGLLVALKILIGH